ncbi:Vasoactive intestinal polypeptide receptor, partial [Clarias magur]
CPAFLSEITRRLINSVYLDCGTQSWTDTYPDCHLSLLYWHFQDLYCSLETSNLW